MDITKENIARAKDYRALIETLEEALTLKDFNMAAIAVSKAYALYFERDFTNNKTYNSKLGDCECHMCVAASKGEYV